MSLLKTLNAEKILDFFGFRSFEQEQVIILRIVPTQEMGQTVYLVIVPPIGERQQLRPEGMRPGRRMWKVKLASLNFRRSD